MENERYDYEKFVEYANKIDSFCKRLDLITKREEKMLNLLTLISKRKRNLFKKLENEKIFLKKEIEEYADKVSELNSKYDKY